MKKYSAILLATACASLSAQNVPTTFIEPSGKDGAPVMPALRLDLSKYNKHGYTFKTSSEHPKRRNKDNLSFSTDEVSGIWNVNRQIGTRTFGGDCVFRPKNESQELRKIKIKGLNPKDSDAQNFIKKNSGKHWYAYAIARHESRQRYFVFNQFNSAYFIKKSSYALPNCGLPDGWGIMQIDSKRGSPINTDEVYNWQKNVLSGIKVMDKARSEAEGYFKAVKRTFPEQWEEPPAYIVVEGTRTKLSYLDACTIQLYNGASVVRRLKTAYGTYSYYRSAFEFDENADSGERWKFKPNVNQYVKKVVRDEIEGALKAENEPIKK